MSREHLACLLS